MLESFPDPTDRGRPPRTRVDVPRVAQQGAPLHIKPLMHMLRESSHGEKVCVTCECDNPILTLCVRVPRVCFCRAGGSGTAAAGHPEASLLKIFAGFNAVTNTVTWNRAGSRGKRVRRSKTQPHCNADCERVLRTYAPAFFLNNKYHFRQKSLSQKQNSTTRSASWPRSTPIVRASFKPCAAARELSTPSSEPSSGSDLRRSNSRFAKQSRVDRLAQAQGRFSN